jgi:hypothetical protein
MAMQLVMSPMVLISVHPNTANTHITGPNTIQTADARSGGQSKWFNQSVVRWKYDCVYQTTRKFTPKRRMVACFPLD